MAKKSTKNAPTYSEAIEELEGLIAKLRSGEVTLDKLPSTMKRANELIDLCRDTLLEVKEEIDDIASKAF
jgi:exodeoxyribonuclease VII small subunit